MKSAYRVSFQYSENTWCSNIAIGEENVVLSHYASKYPSVHLEPATSYDVELAERKGMPIIRL